MVSHTSARKYTNENYKREQLMICDDNFNTIAANLKIFLLQKFREWEFNFSKNLLLIFFSILTLSRGINKKLYFSNMR